MKTAKRLLSILLALLLGLGITAPAMATAEAEEANPFAQFAALFDALADSDTDEDESNDEERSRFRFWESWGYSFGEFIMMAFNIFVTGPAMIAWFVIVVTLFSPILVPGLLIFLVSRLFIN